MHIVAPLQTFFLVFCHHGSFFHHMTLTKIIKKVYCITNKTFRALGRITKRRKVVVPDEDVCEETSQELAGDWQKSDPGLIGSMVPDFHPPAMAPDVQTKLSMCSTAYEFYKLFNSPQFLENTIPQSKLYVVQKNKEQLLQLINEDNVRCMEAVLLHSGKKQSYKQWK